jgi:hypothetical protein
MRHLLKTATLLAFLVLGSASIADAQVSFGIRIGPPPPSRVLRVHPARPGLDFVWVDGFWAPVGNHYRWHDGYWARPPYRGARWIGPRYDGQRFFNGRWDGDRGRRVDRRYRDRDFRSYRR